MTYHWNPIKRRYEDERGKPVTPAQLRAYLESYIDSNKNEIEREADSLIAKGASAALITAFFVSLRQRIKEMHGTAGIIAYGGESEMSPERWARVEKNIVREILYAEGFETVVKDSRLVTDEIVSLITTRAPVSANAVERAVLSHAPSELKAALSTIVENPAVVGDVITVLEPAFDSLIWGEVGSRGRMYADATYSTWANSEKAREGDAGLTSARRVCVDDESSCEDCPALATTEYLPLNEVADIGDSQCSSRCRCWLEFDYAGIEPLTIDRGVYA